MSFNRSDNRIKIITILMSILMIVMILGSIELNPLALTNYSVPINTAAAGPSIISSDNNFVIDNWDTGWTNQTYVEQFANKTLPYVYNLLVNTWGFPDPNTKSSQPPIEVTIEKKHGYNGWACCADREDNFKMGFRPAFINCSNWDHEPLQVAGHEFFHICQFTHPDYPPKDWVLEGMARMSEDKLNTYLDHHNIVGISGQYLRQVHSYLGNSHTKTLTDLAYDAVLFWTYCSEQFGTDHTDPDYGIDFISKFWDTSINPSGTDGITMFNNVMQNLSTSRRFRDVFADFSIANYAKDFDSTTVPPEWTYIDDNPTDGSGNYGTVSKVISGSTLTTTNKISGTNHPISRWSSKYYEINVDSGVKLITIQFNQSTNNKLYYALLCTKGNDVEYYYTVESKNFRRAIVNEGFDKVCVIVIGLENSVTNPARIDYSFEGSDPLINIEWPLNSPENARARVGSPTNPNKFLAIVDVAYRKTAPAHGLMTDNFKAYINNKEATVLSATDVYGKYFLIINPPTQTSDGLYGLKIDLIDSNNNIITSDTEDSCVYYNNTYYDNMLVIDKSGSMSINGKIDAAKSAAKLFVDSFLSDDLLGVVEFNDNAITIHNLMKLTTTNRNNAITTIDGITPGGLTSVGDGLWNAQEELYTRGVKDNPDAIILLSDGLENMPMWISDVKPNLLGNHTPVHVVTIGADAAYKRMQQLSADTGGVYFHCFDPASGDIPNDLAEIYRAISEDIKGLQRFYHDRGVISPSNSKIFQMDITNDMESVEIVAHYNASMDPESIDLFDPTGTLVAKTFSNSVSGMGFAIWHINSPMTGIWNLTINVNGLSSNLRYLVEASAKTIITMDLLDPPNGKISNGWGNCETIGTPIQFTVLLSDRKPITNAIVTLNVTPPNWKSHHTRFIIPLYDDGNHGDNLKDDGIYGNLFTPTSENGSYQYIINVSGDSNDNINFKRIRTGAFHIILDREKSADNDQDGLPNNWETYYGLDPNDSAGEQGKFGDPDNDLLLNYEEFFYGTDPLNPDTDFGGESDGSEVSASRNPLDPADDSITAFPRVRVYPDNGFIYFRLPKASSVPYNNLTIYRSPTSIFNYNTIVYSGPYLEEFNDTTVVNYQTYYYRFVGSSGTLATGMSVEYEAIPKLCTLAPEASVIINNGAEKTSTNKVTLRIIHVENDMVNNSVKTAFSPKYMRISNNVSLIESLPWVTYSEEIVWYLSSGAGEKVVYVQLKDDQTVPEVSPIFSAAIYYTGSTFEIGIESTVTLLLIVINIVTIAVIFKKKQKIPNLISKSF